MLWLLLLSKLMCLSNSRKQKTMFHTYQWVNDLLYNNLM